jgi:multidrug efflux pump subunit AcrA (membrane-fusion protein)
MKKTLLPLLLALTLLLSACGGVAVREATPTPYPTPVRETFTVERGDILVEATLFGEVAPRVLAEVPFEISGTAGSVYVQTGDVVEEGQLLAELEELKDLGQKASANRDDIRRAQIALEIEELALEKARAEGLPEYDIQAQLLRVELAEMDFKAVLASFGLDPESEIDAFGQLDALVARARLYAPIGGTILSAVEVGRPVNPNNPSFIIGDPNQLDLVAQIETNRMDELESMFEGMGVVIWPSSRPEVLLSGTIRQLPAPYGNGPEDSRAITLRIDQQPGEETYLVGERLSIRVTLADKKGVLWLPPEAVRTSAGRTFVLINSPEGPKRIEVETGLRTTLMVEIVSGLEEGQVVLNP